jgi:flagellar hook-associated protein 3 FlgL
MRVTSTTMALAVTNGLQSSIGHVQDAQERLSSGRRINEYSDGPADATAALRLKAQESDWASYGKSADDAKGWLDAADNQLQSMSTLLRRVRELTLSSANSVLTDDQREAMASEVDQLRDQLASDANGRYLDRPLFAGFGSAAVVRNLSGWAYTGDSGQVMRQIAPQITLQVNIDGQALLGFGATPGTDVFSALDKIAADMRSGDVAALGTTDLTALDTRVQAITAGLTVVGSRATQVDAAKEAGKVEIESLKANRSELEDADLAETALQLQQAQAGYQAALAATARLSMPTLASYLQ